MPRYLLIDFMNMAFRAHYGYDAQMSFTGEGGVPTGMTYGLLTMTLALIRDTGATHVAFAAESRTKTINAQRVDIQSITSPVVASAFQLGYKGGRKSQDSDFAPRLNLSDQACAAMGWPVYRSNGYEADDTLAALAKQISAQGDESVIVTGDQDLWQCVSETCTVWAPKFSGVYQKITPEVLPGLLYGFDADKIPELKALIGDKSDGYPGCPGIGPKGAVALLEAYGDVAGIYDHIDEVKGAAQTKLRENEDLVRLCHQLAQLDPDAPVEFDPSAGEVVYPARQEAFDFIRRHSMKSLEKRLGNTAPEEVVESPGVTWNIKEDDDYKDAVATWGVG